MTSKKNPASLKTRPDRRTSLAVFVNAPASCFKSALSLKFNEYSKGSFSASLLAKLETLWMPLIRHGSQQTSLPLKLAQTPFLGPIFKQT
jgi:hypothetical protein